MQKKETSCRLTCNSLDTEEHRWKLWVCRNLFTFIFYLIFLSSRKQYVDKTRVCKSLKLATCFLYDNSPTYVCEQDISPIRLTFAPPVPKSSYSAFCISFTTTVPRIPIPVGSPGEGDLHNLDILFMNLLFLFRHTKSLIVQTFSLFFLFQGAGFNPFGSSMKPIK